MTKIIAEFCQNHNGDTKILTEMLYSAKENGATHAKIQTIFADDLSFRQEFEDGLQSNGEIIAIKRPFKPEYDRLKKLEVSFDDHHAFLEACRKIDIIPLTTCFTRGSVSRIKEIGFKEIKVASYDCGSLPLIRELAAAFETLIISTGATYDNEIAETANYLNSIQKPFSFLHCVTIYPTPLSEMHLSRMNFLRKYTPEVGLSDHSLVERDGVKSSIIAVYEGAKYIERHFTILEKDQTKDGPVSIQPRHLKELSNFVKLARDAQERYIKDNIPEYSLTLGNEHRELSPAELLNRSYYRGRFATKVGNRTVYNWEDVAI